MSQTSEHALITDAEGPGAPVPLPAAAPCLTKIVATLGPACDDPETVQKLFDGGVGVFRLNFSHGTLEDHTRRLRMVRDLASALGTTPAVLGDLCGPKIRVATVPNPGIEVRVGQEIEFKRGVGSAHDGATPVFGCIYEPLVDEVQPGQRVLINDGAVRTLAVEASGGTLKCRVIVGGLITSHKGINLPDTQVSAPAITERDWECVQWAVQNGLDYLALSFVRRAEEVRTLRKGLTALCEGGVCGVTLGGATPDPTIPIIAKIEKPQAVQHIDEILSEADGIMVARGDLGVEMDLARVPVIQKSLIARAQRFGKPCIVATQMLETMIERPLPTRAEVSDVANAIFDRTDAVMLSGETAAGKYPVLAVETMRRIALATEERIRELPGSPTLPARAMQLRNRTVALAHGAWDVAQDIGARLVAAWSQNGGSARYLSRMGLRVPILAFSSSPTSVRRMNLLYGVTPILAADLPVHRSDFDALVDRLALKHGLARGGDPIVLLSGKPFGAAGVVNTISVRRVGEATPD